MLMLALLSTRRGESGSLFATQFRPHSGGNVAGDSCLNAGNYLSDEGETQVREAYGPNYERLVALKHKYDPANLFRMNHNIRPS